MFAFTKPTQAPKPRQNSYDFRLPRTGRDFDCAFRADRHIGFTADAEFREGCGSRLLHLKWVAGVGLSPRRKPRGFARASLQPRPPSPTSQLSATTPELSRQDENDPVHPVNPVKKNRPSLTREREIVSGLFLTARFAGSFFRFVFFNDRRLSSVLPIL